MPIGPRIGQGGPVLFILPEILPPEASGICHTRHRPDLHSALAISSFMISLVPP
jgi:hypothetical protein